MYGTIWYIWYDVYYGLASASTRARVLPYFGILLCDREREFASDFTRILGVFDPVEM